VSPALVVDASIALKWVLPEDDSELAERLLTDGAALHAPAFILVEIANALWVKMRARILTEEEARDILKRLRSAPLALWDGEEPLPETLSLARQLDHAVYDCAYLALALHLDGGYVTADRRFWRKARAKAQFAGRVLRLEDVATGS
jgi:predicted nucleic acid-binding protein